MNAEGIPGSQTPDPLAGRWNDSLSGVFLWTNSNFCEAISDIMTPATISVWQIYLQAVPFQLPGFPLVGVIAGRPYINLSLLASMGCAMGADIKTVLQRSKSLWGRVPAGVDVPLLPLTRWQLLRLLLPALFRVRRALRVSQAEMQAFLAACPAWCQRADERIRGIGAPAELAALWLEELRPYFGNAWRMARAALDAGLIGRLRRELASLLGMADANVLLSGVSGSDQLASLGPLLGISRVVRQEMSREHYLEQYEHRGSHELELSIPRPAEHPACFEQQLALVSQSPVQVEALIEKQRAEVDAAWQRLVQRYPRRVKSLRRDIDLAAASTRRREAMRSEATRLIWVIRKYCLRAAELLELENIQDVYYLTLDEMRQSLSGDRAALQYIPTRREKHARYSALPLYPAIIIGHFDPFKWAANPNQRSDVVDGRQETAPASPEIRGFAGAIGEVEGFVRRMDSPEEGEHLQPGEILVTATTNIGWTPLFLRAAGVVTDLGAPLSHAAIVARELGIPAVVGCGNATLHLQTGDRVRVDGGQGVVTILREHIA